MSRYFFNIYDGCTMLDEEGTELLDIYAARKEALHVAERLIDNVNSSEDLGEKWRIEVTTETGTLLLRLYFQIVEPVTTSHPVIFTGMI